MIGIEAMIFHSVAIGVIATLVFDAWLLLQQQLGLPTMSFGMLGRWIGHMGRGTWKHDSIAKSSPIASELAIGWVAHYAIGVIFAGLMVGLIGREPTFFGAIIVGLATVSVPLLVMQPAMGAGIASTKTPTPLHNCVRSVTNHAVFGIALYLAAQIVSVASK